MSYYYNTMTPLFKFGSRKSTTVKLSNFTTSIYFTKHINH